MTDPAHAPQAWYRTYLRVLVAQMATPRGPAGIGPGAPVSLPPELATDEDAGVLAAAALAFDHRAPVDRLTLEALVSQLVQVNSRLLTVTERKPVEVGQYRADAEGRIVRVDARCSAEGFFRLAPILGDLATPETSAEWIIVRYPIVLAGKVAAVPEATA